MALSKLLIVGDINCPGENSQLDPGLSNLFESFSLQQHVQQLTRQNNLLDAIISDMPSSVGDVTVTDAGCISDL